MNFFSGFQQNRDCLASRFSDGVRPFAYSETSDPIRRKTRERARRSLRELSVHAADSIGPRFDFLFLRAFHDGFLLSEVSPPARAAMCRI